MCISRLKLPFSASVATAIALLLVHFHGDLEAQDKPKATLTGSWRAEKVWVLGEWLPKAIAEQEHIHFKKDEMTMVDFTHPARRYETKYKFTLNEAASPQQIDIHMSPKHVVLGIYHLENDSLYLSLNWRGNQAPRPKLFVPNDGLAGKIYKLVRQK